MNSEIVLEQGRRVDPEHDVIRVDGARIPPPRRHRYLALNKPRGVVATMHDPEGRRTIADLLPTCRPPNASPGTSGCFTSAGWIPTPRVC